MTTQTTNEKLFMLTATAPNLSVNDQISMRQEFKKVEALPQLMLHLNNPTLKNIVLQEITHSNKGEALFILQDYVVPGEDYVNLETQIERDVWKTRKGRHNEMKRIVSSL